MKKNYGKIKSLLSDWKKINFENKQRFWCYKWNLYEKQNKKFHFQVIISFLYLKQDKFENEIYLLFEINYEFIIFNYNNKILIYLYLISILLLGLANQKIIT